MNKYFVKYRYAEVGSNLGFIDSTIILSLTLVELDTWEIARKIERLKEIGTEKRYLVTVTDMRKVD